jgi:hypothetical protein
MSSIVSIEWKQMRGYSGTEARCDGSLLYAGWPAAWYLTSNRTPPSPPGAPWSELTPPPLASMQLAHLISSVPDGPYPDIHVTVFWTSPGLQVIGKTFGAILSQPVRLALAAWPQADITLVRSQIFPPDWFDRSLLPIVDVLEVMLS